MSQHIKSNTDLSNNSNFDADVCGLMTGLSHEESNATDRSSESTSILQPKLEMGITLMGLNHLQSSPLQQFVNPNINAPKLEIPPSKVPMPDITPNGDHDEKHELHFNSKTTKFRNKPPDVQLPNEEEKEIRHHPITPNTYTELSLTELSSPLPALSPIPPQQNTDSPSLSQPLVKDFSPTDMAQLAAMSHFLPQFWNCLQDLTQNVNSIQQQFAKLNHSKAQQQMHHSSHSSVQTRYRSQSHQHSQSNSSVNSLRTQTSIASNSTFNYSNSNDIPPTYSRRSLRSAAPGATSNEKSSSRRSTRRKKSTHFLNPQSKKSIVYNKYSQYQRRKSIGPGAVGNKSPQSRNGSVSPHTFAYSPKGIKQYQLTADSLELLHISQRQKKMVERLEENKSEDVAENNKKRDRRQRNRSQTVFISEKKQRVIQKHAKRRTISGVNNNKIDDRDAVFTDDDDFLDDEVSLYSSAALDTMTSIASTAPETVASQTPPITNTTALSIIRSTSEHSQFGVVSPSNININANKIRTNIDQILFEEEVEGNDDKDKISNKFHRKKNPNKSNTRSRDRKPSSSTSTITNRSNSELSISSTATYNDSRSVPHSPVVYTKHTQVTAASVTKGDRRKSAGTHLYPTPKSSRAHVPTLIQSRSAHNIYAIKATAAVIASNTDTPTDNEPTTPRNTPNISSTITPLKPYAYDINATSVFSITEKTLNKRNSLTPPQEDKEQDGVDNRYGLQLDADELMESASGDCVIVDDEDMILNADKVNEVQVYNGYRYNTELTETQNNVVLEAAHVLFTERDHKNGEDSISVSMTSSRPPSTKINKNVHFDMHSIKDDYEIHDIEENKVAIDAYDTTPEINYRHNLFPSQVKNAGKRGKNNKKRGHDKILKLKNHIAYHHLNGKNRRGNLRKLKLSQQNLKAHNGLNQLKNKLMDAKLEKQHVAKMTTEQLQEMLIYINRIQWLILDEKQKRECCRTCSIACTSFALLLPCNHQSVCYHCASNLRNCPICNQAVSQIVLPRK